jgi:hypothetical protein
VLHREPLGRDTKVSAGDSGIVEYGKQALGAGEATGEMLSGICPGDRLLNPEGRNRCTDGYDSWH